MAWLAIVTCLLIVLGAMAPALADQITGKRVALVIGNSRYLSVGRLANPGNDATLMAASLKASGFALIGGDAQLDLDKARFDAALAEFGRAIAGVEVVLFYYSGHGLQVDGTNFLVPVDAKPKRREDLDFQMVSADLVLRQMTGSGTRLNILILDACRNNPFSGSGLRSGGGGLAEMKAPEGTLISYSTQPGAVALDGTGRDSPFTLALAAAMRQPGLDVFRMFNQAGLDVNKTTGGQQEPWLSASPIEGEFFFAAPAGAPVPASPPAPAAPAETAALVPPSPGSRLLSRPGAPAAQAAVSQPTSSGLNRAAGCNVESTVYRWQAGSVSPVHMTLSNDGGWCWITPKGNGFFLKIVAPPSHGETTTMPDSDGLMRIAYRPASGFLGADHFSVGLAMVRGVVTLDMTVDVVK
jgi:hypothetical protein